MDGAPPEQKQEEKNMGTNIMGEKLPDEIIEVDPLYLTEHSVLENIPRLTADQLAALEESITSNGLMDPLSVVPSPKAKKAYLIIDGRHRFAILRKLNKPIPCIVKEEADPLSFAIEKAVQGRQLTKSGVVLMLFLNHPDLADEQSRKARIKAGKAPCTSDAGYAQLAERYKVPRNYFTDLADIREQYDDEKWEHAKRLIFEGETPITRIQSALAGEIITKGKKRSDPNYAKLAGSAITTVCRAFQKWDKIKWSAKDKRQTAEWASARAVEMFKAIPEGLYQANIQAIAETWKPHHKQALIKALKAKS